MNNINSVMKEFKAFILKGNIIDMAWASLSAALSARL